MAARVCLYVLFLLLLVPLLRVLRPMISGLERAFDAFGNVLFIFFLRARQPSCSRLAPAACAATDNQISYNYVLMSARECRQLHSRLASRPVDSMRRACV